MSVKTCTKCKKKKSLSEFRKHPNTIGGRHTQCRGCLRAYSRAYYYKKKENRHEKNLAPHCPRTPRRKSAQAVNEVAVTMPHQIPLGEAYSHLKTIEGMLQTLYRYAPAQATTRKKIKDLAAQVKVCATEVDRYERRTRLVHPDHKH
ncbi:hypothetical protein ACWIB8_05285 [Corynebacterium flavescens]